MWPQILDVLAGALIGAFVSPIILIGVAPPKGDRLRGKR